MASDGRNTEGSGLVPEVREILKSLKSLKSLARPSVDPDQAGAPLEAISAQMEELFRLRGHEDVGEWLVDAVHEGFLHAAQAEQALSIGTWSGATNGADLQPTLERWLVDGDDPLKVRLALSIGVYPFEEEEEMARVLTRIAVRRPAFAEKCQAMIGSRRDRSPAAK